MAPTARSREPPSAESRTPGDRGYIREWDNCQAQVYLTFRMTFRMAFRMAFIMALKKGNFKTLRRYFCAAGNSTSIHYKACKLHFLQELDVEVNTSLFMSILTNAVDKVAPDQ